MCGHAHSGPNHTVIGSPGVTDRGRGLYRSSTPRSSSDSVNGEEGQTPKPGSSSPSQQASSLGLPSNSTPRPLSSPSQQASSLGLLSNSTPKPGAAARRPRGFHGDEDSMFGLHGNVGGRGSTELSLSLSSSPVRVGRPASFSSDDVTGLNQSQSLSRSSTLPYDMAPPPKVKPRPRPGSPGNEMVTLEQFLQESNVKSPPMVSTGSREDLMTDYFTRGPSHSAPIGRDQAPPTSYVTPTVQPANQRPGQSVKPSPRQPVGQSPASAPPPQRGSQSLSRAFSLASADLLRSNGPDGYRGNEGSPGQSDAAVLRRVGGGARERPLSARLAGPANQQADMGFLSSAPLSHSSSLNLQTQRLAERERDRERGVVAMVTPVRAVPALRLDDGSEQGEGLREAGRPADPAPKKEGGEGEGEGGGDSTPASPDPNNDPQTVWYEYGCV